MTQQLQVTVTPDQEPDEAQSTPEKPVCRVCQSSYISFDATACWDSNDQRFEYDIARGNAFCLDCEQEHLVDWVPV